MLTWFIALWFDFASKGRVPKVVNLGSSCACYRVWVLSLYIRLLRAMSARRTLYLCKKEK